MYGTRIRSGFPRHDQRPLNPAEFRFVGVGGAGGAGGSTIPLRYRNAQNVAARKPFFFPCKRSAAFRKARGVHVTGKQRTETRIEGTIPPRGSRTFGAQRKPRKLYANAPDGRRWSNPAKSTEADAGHANGAKRISPKNLYTSREASAICSQRKNGRTPTPDGNGRRKWKRGGEYDSELTPLVRAIRSASASAQIGADSGAAGGERGEWWRRTNALSNV